MVSDQQVEYSARIVAPGTSRSARALRNNAAPAEAGQVVRPRLEEILGQLAQPHAPTATTWTRWRRSRLCTPGQDGGRSRGPAGTPIKGNEFDHVVIYAANRELMPRGLVGPDPGEAGGGAPGVPKSR